MSPWKRAVANRLSRTAGQPATHDHRLLTVVRRRWQDLFRESHEFRCWSCPLVVREPK